MVDSTTQSDLCREHHAWLEQPDKEECVEEEPGNSPLPLSASEEASRFDAFASHFSDARSGLESHSSSLREVIHHDEQDMG